MNKNIINICPVCITLCSTTITTQRVKNTFSTMLSNSIEWKQICDCLNSNCKTVTTIINNRIHEISIPIKKGLYLIANFEEFKYHIYDNNSEVELNFKSFKDKQEILDISNKLKILI